jgi:hypothetical protein
MTEPGTSYKRRRVAKRAFGRVEKGLAGTLQPGEELQSAFFAHRYVPGLQLLLLLGAIGDIVYAVVARPYYTALTSQRFFLLKGSRFGLVSRPRDPVFSSDADSVRIEEPRKFLVRAITNVRAGAQDEVRLAVHRQYWQELHHMRELLVRRGTG